MKVEFIANAVSGKKSWSKGQIVDISVFDYNNVFQSCLPTKESAPTPKSKSQNILVVKAHGIGNVVNVTPMLQGLREIMPDVEIDVLVQAGNACILEGWDVINAVYEYPGKAYKTRDYGMIIIGLPELLVITEAVIKAFPGVKVIRGDMYTLKVMHEARANYKLLKQIKQIEEPLSLKTYCNINENGKKILSGIAICAGFLKRDHWKNKNWGYKRYGKLIGLIKRKYPKHHIFVLGTGSDRQVLDHVRGHSRVIDCVDALTIPESANVIKKCDFLVSNDTGMAHIAGAVGTKAYTIFTATYLHKNHGLGDVTAIYRDVSCRPCQNTSRLSACDGMACRNILPTEVMAIIQAKEKKYPLAVVMPLYNRYEMLICTLDSIIKATPRNVKFIFMDDASPDYNIGILIETFEQTLPASCEVVYYRAPVNRGKKYFGETMRMGIEQAHNCDRVIFWQDDLLVNRWIFRVVEKTAEYLQDGVGVLTFMTDNRSKTSARYKKLREYDKFFDHVQWFDGPLPYMRYETIKKCKYESDDHIEGSKFWSSINKQIPEHDIIRLRYKKSLCEHIGNVASVMNGTERAKRPILARVLNLWKKPEVLK